MSLSGLKKKSSFNSICKCRISLIFWKSSFFNVSESQVERVLGEVENLLRDGEKNAEYIKCKIVASKSVGDLDEGVRTTKCIWHYRKLLRGTLQQTRHFSSFTYLMTQERLIHVGLCICKQDYIRHMHTWTAVAKNS